MQELLNAAFSIVNLFPTILLLVILLYWLFVILGAIDLNFFDVEVDADADVDVDVDMDVEMDVDADLDANVDVDADLDADVDADMDADTEVSAEGALVSMNSVLTFFNLGKVPFMLLLSFFILPLWIISILTNHFLGNESALLALVLLIPNIIVSLIVAKILTTPFAAIYTRMAKNSDESFKYAGKMCTVLMPTNDKKMGQAEIQYKDSTYRINVLTKEGTTLEKGDSALVINHIKDKNCYLVEPYKI